MQAEVEKHIYTVLMPIEYWMDALGGVATIGGMGANSVSRRRGVRNAARGDAPAGRATQKPAAVEAQGVSIIRALICKPGGIAAGDK
jgi:hypothetical protein